MDAVLEGSNFEWGGELYTTDTVHSDNVTMNNDQLGMLLWANEVQRNCLLECGGDIEAGMQAAQYIIDTQPIPENLDTAFARDSGGREHKSKGPGGGQFTKGSGGDGEKSEKGKTKDGKSTNDRTGKNSDPNKPNPKLEKLLDGWNKPIKVGPTKARSVSTSLTTSAR